MISKDEIEAIKTEIRETTSLLHFAVSEGLPVSQNGIKYLIERLKFLRMEIAALEKDLMLELLKLTQCN